MKKSLILSACAVVLALTGCTSYQYTARQTSIARHDIQATPTVVDVHADYNRRIETTSGWHKRREDAMNECRYLALTQNKIGVVVDPIFKIEYQGRKVKASMTGFAGYFINPRTFTEDMEATKKYTREEIENYLILKNPEVLKYIHNGDEVVNIYRTPSKPKAEEPKLSEQPAQEQSKTGFRKQK